MIRVEKRAARFAENWFDETGAESEAQMQTAVQTLARAAPVVVMPMQDVKRRVAATGSHWFEPATMRFFDSRVARTAYVHADGRAFFVSSEQFRGYTVPDGARRYSVRVVDVDGDIGTVGKFQAFATRSAAVRVARRLACGLDNPDVNV